ncbi:MAG: recombinase family protein [Nitrospirota bacterium]
MDNEIDITKLKYVLYVRKSTDDPQRQVRSIDDQISECVSLSKRLNLTIVGDPIVEKKSAKKPDKRPLFTQMLKDLRKGKFNGILAWNPDRLARSMREGGEIIDMIDDGYIIDLKFVTHHFSNDANGKMLLGMAFVLSKQYSDNLSQNVARGVKNSFEEGKAPIPKHGYIRNENGVYKPDGKMYTLMCEAWQKRLVGVSLDEITKYLNTNGYKKVVKSTGKGILMTKQMLSEIFRDTFYYGVLKQKDREVDLRTIYEFTPAVTEKEFYRVQTLSGRRVVPYRKKRLTYYPLKMMVTCSFCGNHMYAGAVKGETKRYLTYRCDNKYCPRKKKSIRGKVIFDFIYDFLKYGLHFTEEDYSRYLKAMESLTGKRQDSLKTEINSKMGRLKTIEREIADISYKILDIPENSIVREANEKRVEEYGNERDQIKADLASLNARIADPKQQVVALENFLNLSKNAGLAIQLGNEVAKDSICRLLFLNFFVDEEKVVSYQAKPPFDELINTRDFLSSRGGET